ncbi:hypothetical protein DL98DRAFT_600750 [Cadophora sp. DSE1049]|nr:hypothetical protein DL98DRAFT_600750 [Cadophora sp. DSE1049]
MSKANCPRSRDKSAIEEVASPSEQQIDTIFQAFEIRHEGDASSNPIIILDDIPSVTMIPDVNTLPRTPERLKKRPRPAGYAGLAARSSSAKKASSKHRCQLSLSLCISRDLQSRRDSFNPVPNIPEGHSPQLNNDIVTVDN